MNVGIAIFPSKEVQDFANSYRKRYDPHYRRIQPHLTLRETESMDAGRFADASAALEAAAAEMEPFAVRFNRISSFYPTSNVIYMALEDPQPVQQCYRTICRGALQEQNRDFLFTPHLTIGQGMGSDECQDVLASLRKVPVDFPFVVDRLHLLYQTEDDAWTVHQTFLLRQ